MVIMLAMRPCLRQCVCVFACTWCTVLALGKLYNPYIADTVKLREAHFIVM